MPNFLNSVATKPRSPTLRGSHAKLSYFSSMDPCSTLPSSPFLSNSFKCFLVILQALSLSAKITKLPSFPVTLQALSLSFLPKSPNLFHNKTANLTCNATATYSHMQLRRCHLFSTLTTTARNPIARCRQNLSRSNGSQVFQPCNDLWYLPKICSRILQICLCISVSNSLR